MSYLDDVCTLDEAILECLEAFFPDLQSLLLVHTCCVASQNRRFDAPRSPSAPTTVQHYQRLKRATDLLIGSGGEDIAAHLSCKAPSANDHGHEGLQEVILCLDLFGLFLVALFRLCTNNVVVRSDEGDVLLLFVSFLATTAQTSLEGD